MKNSSGCICGAWRVKDESHADYCREEMTKRKVQFVSHEGTLGDPLPPEIASLKAPGFTIENYPKFSDFGAEPGASKPFYSGNTLDDPLVNYLQRCIDHKESAIVEGERFKVKGIIHGETRATFWLMSERKVAIGAKPVDEIGKYSFRASDLNVQALTDQLAVDLVEDDPNCARLKDAACDQRTITIELATWMAPRQYKVERYSTGQQPSDLATTQTVFILRGLPGPAAQEIDEVAGIDEITRGAVSGRPRYRVESSSPLASSLAACMATDRPVKSGDKIYKVEFARRSGDKFLTFSLKEI